MFAALGIDNCCLYSRVEWFLKFKMDTHHVAPNCSRPQFQNTAFYCCIVYACATAKALELFNIQSILLARLWIEQLYCMCQLLRKISILQHGPDVGIRTMRCCVCNSAFLPHLYTFQLEDCLSNDLVKCAEKKIHNFFLIIWDNTADKFFKLYLSLVLFKMVIEQSNTQDQLMSEVTYYRQ